METNAAPELLKKYNVAAPRYTSYPTVPYWDKTPTETEWLRLLAQAFAESKEQQTPAALYMHIPFCEQLCTFCGCNTRITKNHGVAKPYIELVHKEWALYRERLALNAPLVSELHLGGGTPTFLSPDELAILLEPVLNSIEIASETEFSLEVDPRVTTFDHLKRLRTLGFTRISLGVQDFASDVQQMVNRIQSFDLVKRCVDAARELGFSSINFDLIYGLPRQTEASVQETFAKVTELRPERIAYYAYAHVPWIKPAHRRFTEADLPEPSLKRRLYELGREHLYAQGYSEIGMDHFALPNDSLSKAVQGGHLHRNFMGYMSRHVSPLLALGVSAISDSWTAFVQNEKSLEAYRARLLANELPVFRGHTLTDEDRSLRAHILNLMTKFYTEWQSEVDPASGFLAQVSDRLQELVRDQLVEVGSNSVRIHPAGRAFIRNVGMAFDARLMRKAPQTNLFSQSI